MTTTLADLARAAVGAAHARRAEVNAARVQMAAIKLVNDTCIALRLCYGRGPLPITGRRLTLRDHPDASHRELDPMVFPDPIRATCPGSASVRVPVVEVEGLTFVALPRAGLFGLAFAGLGLLGDDGQVRSANNLQELGRALGEGGQSEGAA